MEMRSSNNPKNVFVLIRLHNIRIDPELDLFVDPWQLHADGVLSLTTESQYEAKFKYHPPTIRLEKLVTGIPSKKVAASGGFARILHRSKSSKSQIEMTLDDPVYTYRSLGFGEIRLLELLPGTGDMPMEGCVRHFPLESAGQYSALSYVWGNALMPFDLQTRDGRIPLTGALNAALRALRNKDTSVILWVDAICINQANDHEKILQIRLLRSIFQKAEKVLAWVGDEKESSNRAIEALIQIRTLALNPDQWPINLTPISSTWSDKIPGPQDSVWGDICEFFQRDWFQRIWVVQELVLGSEVRILCGKWDVNWDDVFAALEICLCGIEAIRVSNARMRRVIPQTKPAYLVGLTRRMFKDPRLSRRFSLLSLLDIFAHCDATKERDKLFALLGLALDAESSVFDADYSSSLETVIRRYAGEFVQRGHTMDLLYRAGTSKSFEFCSWIPKWTGREPRRTISTWGTADGNFSAGGKSCAKESTLNPGLDELQVSGIGIDTIEQLCQKTTGKHDIISVILEIHSSIDKLQSYPTGEPLEDLKLKVPIGNALAPCSDDCGTLELNVPQVRNSDRVFNWKDEFSVISSVEEMVEFLQKKRDSRERGWKYWTTAAAFAKRLSNGRFCVTKTGYVGIVPYEANLGDKICVLHGALVPFVLRKTAGSDSLYKLVGECYIHGIMYGEALSVESIQERRYTLI
jgi:Heterokaryon incompatibility protein (HET)